MSAMLNRELENLGKVLRGWRLQLLLMWGGALVCLTATLMGVFDFFFKAGDFERWLSFVLLAGLVSFTLTAVTKALRRRVSHEALAVTIERTFPELDNHLINYLQFSRDAGSHPLKAAYVRQGAPHINTLEISKMKNHRLHRYSMAAAAAAVILLVMPGFIWGNLWSVSLWRMVNPLAAVEPVTLTRIVAVEPGDKDIMQGQPLVLTTRVEGLRGHPVRLDFDPDDARRTTYEIGRLSDSSIQSFSHRVPRVNTRFRYRFRAGDSAPSQWYTVSPRPPPSLVSLSMLVQPPAYTGQRRISVDMETEDVPRIPYGSEISLTATANTAMEKITARTQGKEPVALEHDAGAGLWRGRLRITGGGPVSIKGRDRFGQELQTTMDYILRPDNAPEIEVMSPQGEAVISPGGQPRIEFRVRDDYGLSKVYLERIAHTGATDLPGEKIKEWEPDNQRTMHQVWRGEPVLRSATLSYRVVAWDNRPEEPQVTRSAPIVFKAPPAAEMSKTVSRLEESGFAALGQIVELQRINLQYCRDLGQAEGQPAATAWQEAGTRQGEVRRLTRELLQNPARPLGGRTEEVASLYANEMVLAIEALARVASQAQPEARRINEAISLQEAILRRLTTVEKAGERTRAERRVSGITALLEALVKKQTSIVEALESPGQAGGATVELAAAQDEQSEDFAEFIRTCNREAEAVRGSDPAFADLLLSVAGEAESRKINEDMLMAAERMERGDAAQAMPLASRALDNLKHLRDMLDEVSLQKKEEKRVEMMEALGEAREKIEKMQEIHHAFHMAMDTIRGHGDKSDELFDVLPEEFLEIVKKNKEALLQIPVDLHIFTDLNVGNELVEDVFSIFQEVEQREDSDQMTPEDVVEVAFAKNLEALEAMREAMDRIDDVEMWLDEAPQQTKVETEALDREEMPEAGVALGALQAEVMDLIGDLLENNEEMARAADDAATTHALPDEGMGHAVIEGDIASFAAKGVSGNEPPDRKEQDGRSNVGRQGMASGETSAGSGTISEGSDVDARRTEDPTQDGQVQLDGEADTEATGGGKLATGKADELGMEGGVRRMDSTEEGSWEGMAAMMAERADSIFAKASMQNIRVDSLKSAAHHIRQMDDAIAKGDISSLHELRNQAMADLQAAQARLADPPSGDIIDMRPGGRLVEDAVQSGPDLAPPRFRDQVSDYYRFLNEAF